LVLHDALGSAGIVLDKSTGQLAEAITYTAYGQTESDYRPPRFSSNREDERFTGKEEDVEVGLVYFGKRYLVPAMARWASADPSAVHAPGEADLNLYAYVHGRVYVAVDPNGLEGKPAPPSFRERARVAYARFVAAGGSPAARLILRKELTEISEQSSDRVPALERGARKETNAIVTHFTDSSSANSTLSSWRGSRPFGTHFLVDRDGGVLATARLDNETRHVGLVQRRCENEGAPCGRTKHGTSAKAITDSEAQKPYPERYPTNADSIGIEVVAKYDAEAKRWQQPTSKQLSAVHELVDILRAAYDLEAGDVNAHAAIGRKTAGEGALDGVSEAPVRRFIGPPSPDSVGASPGNAVAK
jgi:RHS repeat-associated protein